MTCHACGFVSVPVQDFGCERCGAHGAAWTVRTLPAEGTVQAAVTVHGPSPVRIGSVHLDAGPVVRARLAPGVDAGARVRGTEHDGTLVFEPGHDR